MWITVTLLGAAILLGVIAALQLPWIWKAESIIDKIWRAFVVSAIVIIIFGRFGVWIWPISIAESTHKQSIEKPIPQTEQPKQPTAKEIATELAKKLQSTPIQPSRKKETFVEKKEVRKKEPTFQDVSPFIVTFGSNSAVIPKNASKENPAHIINWGGTDILYAYVENGKLYVNTILYGDSPFAAVDIKHNEFVVRPSRWDRNFDETALEIVDENLLPRLQLVYKNPHNIVINGIFKFQGGLILMEETGMTVNPSSINPKFRRIFKYPSRLYQGEELNEPHL